MQPTPANRNVRMLVYVHSTASPSLSPQVSQSLEKRYASERVTTEKKD